jgi:hypothetical protein
LEKILENAEEVISEKPIKEIMSFPVEFSMGDALINK